MKKNFGIRLLQAVLVLFLSIVFLYAGVLLGDVFEAPFKASGNDAIKFAGTYFDFIGIWILIIIFCLFTKKSRKLLLKLVPGRAGNHFKTVFGMGLILGLGLNLLVAIVALLHGDIALSFSEFNPAMILLFILCITIQGGAEELIHRFYIYQKIADLFPEFPFAPVIVNAVMFSAIHMGNDGVTPLALSNIVLVGILYSLIIYYYDSFWAAAIAHMSWNFCQNILLGLPNSGIVSAYSVWKLDASTATNSFAYNVNFGIEGTILSSLLLAIACVVIVILGRKKKQQTIK